jgi:YjjG family noncanonical pyrimidine nucleotidase
MFKNKITDVFFDLDHTLWDFEKNSALTFETIFKIHHVDIDMTSFLNFYVPFNFAYWEKYRKDEITQQQLRYSRLKDSFDAVHYTISDDMIEVLASAYIHYLPTYSHLFEGAIELLDYLQPKYNLHIITNGFTQIQQSKLDNSAITHYFKSITNSEIAGVKKPNQIIFDYALQLGGAKKEHSIMIGDCIEADVQGALDAGFEAIFFNEHKKLVPSGINQVNHLRDIKLYL